jgi:hypothetical protein
VSKVSELNTALYKAWCRPWVKAWAQRPVADALGKLHPLRLQRKLLSDALPLAPWVRQQAALAREHRATVADGHPLKQLEQAMANHVSGMLDQLRDQRNAWTVNFARMMYGPFGLGAWFKPDVPDAVLAHERALGDIEQARDAVLGQVAEGGFPEAVCRIVLAGMASVGSFERRSLRLARLLALLPSASPGAARQPDDWVQTLKAQARLTAVAPIEALNALEDMLPDGASRERALAVAAAVMMIEPTLDNPRSEIIEFLIGTLGVDPQRVISLARKLTAALELPVKKKTQASSTRRMVQKSSDRLSSVR